MFQPQTINLVYVGSKKFKTDNVCGTGTLWIGYGDVQTVERKHAPKFLKHPDVWMTEEEFKQLQEPQVSDSTEQIISTNLGGEGGAGNQSQQLSDSTESAPATSVNAAALGLGSVGTAAPVAPAQDNADLNAGANANTNADANAGNVDDTNTDAKSNTGNGDALAVIKNAILSLEQGNASHFSARNGAPLIGAVRNAAGDESITAADMRAAWVELGGKSE